MGKFVLTCCSTADLSKEYFERRQIPVIFFHFELDGVSYLDDCGESVPPERRISRWLEKADAVARDWKPSESLFLD